MVNELEKWQCTGCGVCFNMCPVNAIEMKSDEKGFLYPKIDDSLCIECGGCDKMCPSINKVVSNNNIEPPVWAAWSLDEEIRYESTSGGVFSELASNMFAKGGVVCGARYNEQHLVEHYIAMDKSQLSNLRQSKYVQSDKKDIYTQVKSFLDSGREVLFCGAPCECAGLLKFLDKKYSNLLCVDFICRGANSPLVYKMFLESLEKKYNSKVSRVWFKNKEHGWRHFSTRIEFENGEFYSEDRYSDIYIRGYIAANLYMRDSCEKCQYKHMPRLSDITLGDFWGIKSEEVGAETDFGTSLVMINSEKGQAAFEQLDGKIFKNQRSFKQACQGNKCIYESPKFNAKMQEFWDDIDKMDIIDNISRFCK